MGACRGAGRMGWVGLWLLLACNNHNEGGFTGFDASGAGAIADGGLDAATSDAGLGGATGDAGLDAAGGGAGAITTGVDGTKMLATLGPDEVAKVCAAGRSLVRDTPSLTANVCKVVALIAATLADPEPQTDAEAQAACQRGYAECTTSLTDGGCTSIASECKATVAQLEACWAATADYVRAAGVSLPACTTLTLARLAQTADMTPLPQPPACVTLDNLGCGELDLTGGE
jgi:hypothetical protein